MSATPLAYAASLIKLRLRSAWEIDQALLRRGVEEDERSATITKLTEVGLLDDERFALAWVHTRDRLAPRGEWLIKQELKRKGIDEATIHKAFEERFEGGEEETEFKQAMRFVEKKLARYENLPRETRNRRLSSLLQRRGFSSDTVRRILNL